MRENVQTRLTGLLILLQAKHKLVVVIQAKPEDYQPNNTQKV